MSNKTNQKEIIIDIDSPVNQEPYEINETLSKSRKQNSEEKLINEKHNIIGNSKFNASEESFRSDMVNWKNLGQNYLDPTIIYTEQPSIDHESIADLEYRGTSYNKKWGVCLPIICYVDRKEHRLYCFYKSFQSEQSKLVSYSAFCIANISLIAFLLEVFETRDWLTLIIVTTQLLFITVCSIRMCILRWAFATIIYMFTKEIKIKKYIRAIVMVRADTFCLEMSVNSLQKDNDLAMTATFYSLLRWSVFTMTQLLTIAYFIMCIFGLPLPKV